MDGVGLLMVNVIDFIAMRTPFAIQYLVFSERVVKIVKKKQKESNQVLQPEKEENIRRWRLYKSIGGIRTARVDMLHLFEAYRQKVEGSKLLRGYRRARRAAMPWRHAYVG